MSLSALVLVLAVASAPSWSQARAQTSTPPKANDRITTPIDETRLVALAGQVSPRAKAKDDQGGADTSMPMNRVVVVFSRTAGQQADLDALLEQQNDPGSANYHNWLTPEEFGDRFGVTQHDMNRMVAWLQGHGFTVVEMARSRTYVAFNGSVAQVEAAFHTSIHRYNVNGAMHYANANAPAVPAALASVVLGVRGLNDFRPRPHGVVVQRHFTSSISGNHFLVPDDFATIYDFKPLYAAGINGTGQAIAVIGQTDLTFTDFNTFRTNAGLPATTVQVMTAPGGDPGVPSGGDVDESNLDLEWAGGVAPMASLIFVNSIHGAFDAAMFAIDQNVAPVLSSSYGACEADLGSFETLFLAPAAQQANAQGMTISASSGDSGAADCDVDPLPVTGGLAVDAPAASPNVTGVGGTTFNEGASTSFWSATNNASSGSAVSYIPEIAWNDTVAVNSFASGGGGASIAFPKPTYQTGPGVPADGARDVPDIALAASPNHDGYLVCSQGSCVNGFRAADNSLLAVGGTSAGAPAFAGFLALMNQKTQSRLGNVNPKLYQAAAAGGGAFHDVTTGDNKQPCQTGTPNCPNGGSIGFSAGVGYDQATGLGSIDANVLANAFGSASAPTISILSPSSAAAGSGDFTLTVNGSGFVAASTVQWNGSARTTTFVSASQLTAAISAADIAAVGSDAVTVLNPGGAGASNAVNFTVAAPIAPVLANLSPGIAAAGGAAFTLTVNGSNFVGSSVVQWNGSARTTTFVSATQLTAAITAADIAAATTASVTVVTGALTSNTAHFLVLASVGSIPLAQSRFFPHIVDGGGFVTKMTITNLTAVSTDVVVEFLSVTGVRLGTAGGTLAGGGTLRISTPESNRLNPNATVEWAIVHSSGTVGTNLFFELANSSGVVGNTIGFNDQPPLTDMTLPVDLLFTPPPGAPIGRTIGIAFVNPSTTTTANITMKLLDSGGNILATSPVTLGALAHFSADVQSNAQFAAVLPNTEFIGAIAISSDIPVVVVALEDDLGPFSALPPLAGRAK